MRLAAGGGRERARAGVGGRRVRRVRLLAVRLLGGGLGAEFLGLDPQYPLKYLVLFLIVVAVGGLGRVTGVFYAALTVGLLDFVLKKYFPQGGTVCIDMLTIVLLLWRPQGLFGKTT